MTDIFQEVEEDVRRERFEKIWKQYGDYIIAGAAAIIVGWAGYQLWTRYEDQQRFNASKTFIAAQEAADSGNTAAAQAMFGKLAQSGPGGYATIAKLAEANTLLVSDKRNDAIRDLQIHRREGFVCAGQTSRACAPPGRKSIARRARSWSSCWRPSRSTPPNGACRRARVLAMPTTAPAP